MLMRYAVVNCKHALPPNARVVALKLQEYWHRGNGSLNPPFGVRGWPRILKSGLTSSCRKPALVRNSGYDDDLSANRTFNTFGIGQADALR